MTRDTRIALFLMGELVAALRANDPDAFRGLLSEGMQELGVREVEELLLDWLYSFCAAKKKGSRVIPRTLCLTGFCLAPPDGFEPSTDCLEGSCSIQLS